MSWPPPHLLRGEEVGGDSYEAERGGGAQAAAPSCGVVIVTPGEPRGQLDLVAGQSSCTRTGERRDEGTSSP